MAVVEFLASSSVVTTFDSGAIKCYRIQNRDRASIEALVKVGEEGVGGKAKLLPRPFPSRFGAVIGIGEWVTEVSSGHGDNGVSALSHKFAMANRYESSGGMGSTSYNKPVAGA
jgi:hypothetical protein